MARYYSERLGLRVSRTYEEEQEYFQSLMDENSDIEGVTNNSDSDDECVPHNAEENEYSDIEDIEERELIEKEEIAYSGEEYSGEENEEELKWLRRHLIAIRHWVGYLEGKKS
ncbi:hypothetical protein HHI36_008511 [Cryptolaemus montrouzieri]|uniref:Uncharacterized protein n=1 Tax=Cryptolaemus montrouzieri TaxID=559131 RepID=A0ABD2MTK7_9CUCU